MSAWRARVAAVVIAPLAAVLLAPVTTTATASAAADTRGRWSVHLTPAGPWLVWRSPTILPTVDSRPEFRVGTRVVGYPRVGAGGRTLRLAVAALGDVEVTDVEAWVGMRRLDARVPSVVPPAAGIAATGDELAVTPPGDPGVPGTFAVEAFDYSAPDLPWPRFDAPMEVLGHAVLPVGVADAPLVLFLHGRHYVCYGADATGFWPCAGSSLPVPSYLGFDYLQRLLASQGYATVSVSANAVNAQDGNTNDGGARARGALVKHHLALLARWSADGSDARWGGRLDLGRVVLVGHSRGGEGVDQAAINTRPSAPYHLAGQVLLAPTDYALQTAPYLPTEVVLGYCDGDLSDLQGQRYVDAAPLLAGDDPSLRSSVLLRGANHNFFNTEWTPGLSVADSEDDWRARKDPLCGSKVSPTRLTAAEQRRAAQTFVAAGVHAFLGEETEAALSYLDSEQPVAVPAAGPALAWTHALGGRRVTARLGDGATVAGSSQACRAGQPPDDATAAHRLPLCGIDGFARQVHWTPADRSLPSVHSAYAAAGLPRHVAFSWTSAGAEGGLALSQPLDLGPADTRLDLRMVVDPRAGPVELQVVLASGGVQWAGPVRALAPLPGSSGLTPLWAQTVRVDPADYGGHLDVSHVDAVLLRAVSPAGQVWLLDASARRPGLDPVPDRTLPRIRLGRVVQPEGDADGKVSALLPFRVLGGVTSPVRFAVAVEQSMWRSFRSPRFTDVTVEPGETGGTIAVRYEADELDDVPRQTQLVHAVPLSGAVTSGFVGAAAVLDDDPAPAVTFAAVHRTVRYGDDIVFRLTVASPVDYYVVNLLRAVRVDRFRPVRTSDIPTSWLRAQMGSVPADVPLARVWHDGFLELAPGGRHALVVVPTLRHPLHDSPKALTVRFSAQYLTPPLRATVRVLPE